MLIDAKRNLRGAGGENEEISWCWAFCKKLQNYSIFSLGLLARFKGSLVETAA